MLWETGRSGAVNELKLSDVRDWKKWSCERIERVLWET